MRGQGGGPLRICQVCNQAMSIGFLHEYSDETYCSTDCLLKEYELLEIEKMLDEKILFWTEWYEVDDIHGI